MNKVKLMHKTVVLIAMHGAELANVLFLPKGAVVIEIFPDLYYRSMYSRYCTGSGVTLLRYHLSSIPHILPDISRRERDMGVDLEDKGLFFPVLEEARTHIYNNNFLYYRRLNRTWEGTKWL